MEELRQGSMRATPFHPTRSGFEPERGNACPAPCAQVQATRDRPGLCTMSCTRFRVGWRSYGCIAHARYQCSSFMGRRVPTRADAESPGSLEVIEQDFSGRRRGRRTTGLLGAKEVLFGNRV